MWMKEKEKRIIENAGVSFLREDIKSQSRRMNRVWGGGGRETKEMRPTKEVCGGNF
jgi:hypothetical protein